jgi:uncharacterized protein VirK/YbjX
MRAPLTREWFRLLQNPKLAPVAEADPHILSKIQRTYLIRTLRAKDRLQALKQHYGFVAQHFPEEMLRQVYSSSGFLLASLPIEGIGQVSLRLAYCHSLGKEGDLTIKLNDEHSGWLIYSLTFSVSVNDAGRRECVIGGLQGYTQALGKERVISLTRRMHGLRPKALVLFALQQLACAWAFTSIRGVSDAMHIYRHYLRRKDLAASYDEFWAESGGRLAADNVFDLPLRPSVRPIATIKPNKRAMYKHRYAMLTEISKQIRRQIPSISTAQPSAPLPWLNDNRVPPPAASGACIPMHGLGPRPVSHHA